MKNLIKLWAVLALATLAFPAKPVKQPAPPPTGNVTVTGTLFPDVTDTLGNVKSVYLSVVDKELPEGGTEYALEGDPKAKDFIKLVYQSLEMTGTYTLNKDGRKVLKIQTFRLLENKPQDIEEEF